MGIRYSELPTTLVPTSDDLVAILDNESATLKTTTLQNAVNCALGSASISGIGDGTVNGAIVYLYNASSGTSITSMTQAEYDALTTAQKNDGRLRLVTT